MKKFFVLVVAILFVGVFCKISNADDSVFPGADKDNKTTNFIKPPKNSRELVGKVISFTDRIDPQKNIWHFSIIGSSEHVMSMYKGVILYVGTVNYSGYQVKEISYNANGSEEWWQIEYYVPANFVEPENRHGGHFGEKSEQIQVISIE